MTMYIGMDVHSNNTMYVVLNEAGKVITEGKIATTEGRFPSICWIK